MQDVEKEVEDVKVEVQGSKSVFVKAELQFVTSPLPQHQLRVKDYEEREENNANGVVDCLYDGYDEPTPWLSTSSFNFVVSSICANHLRKKAELHVKDHHAEANDYQGLSETCWRTPFCKGFVMSLPHAAELQRGQ